MNLLNLHKIGFRKYIIEINSINPKKLKELADGLYKQFPKHKFVVVGL